MSDMNSEAALLARIANDLFGAEQVLAAIDSGRSQRLRDALEEPVVAPRTPVEKWLASQWAELLGLNRVGIKDNFFYLGGSSLQATRVVARLRESFGVSLSLQEMFRTPTIEALAHTLEQLDEQPPADKLITATDRDGSLPLSYAQQRLWFLDRWEARQAVYNIPFAMFIDGGLDAGLLESCLTELAMRHESLRTVFPGQAGDPVQQVNTAADVPLRVVDLDHLPVDERDAACRRLLLQEACRSFDLERGPLFRALLVRIEDRRFALLLCMHHIISDGWSLGIICRDLSVMYAAHAAGCRPQLPALKIQYPDYSHWQRQWMESGEFANQLAFWKRQLAGELPNLELPCDRTRAAVRSARGSVRPMLLDTQLTSRLELLGQSEGATDFMLLLAVFYVLLHRYSGQDDIIVGTPIASRNHPGIEDLAGFFVNTLALRCDLAGNPDFRGFLRQVRKLSLEAYDNQDLPFESLVNELDIEREPSRTPVFQAMFVFQNAQLESLKLPGSVIKQELLHTSTSKFDLTLEITRTDLGLKTVWEYDSDLFDADTIDRFINSYRMLLEGVVRDPAAQLSALPVLTQAECRRLLEMLNPAGAGYPADTCIHTLFEQQAVRSADAVAVVFDGEEITYGVLNQRANQLAHYLLGLGAGPGVKLGLCMERTPGLVVAILAILKTGACYVPLDPAYPRERLAFMLTDAAAPVVVTEAGLAGKLPVSGVRSVCIDGEAGSIAECSGGNPGIEITPDALAYIIYTSGSTGQPKGVEIPHSNVVRLFAATEAWFHFGPDDVWTLFHSYAFDFSVWEIWGALLHGGRLVVVPFEITRSPDRFYSLLCHESVTVLNQTPTAFQQLIRAEADSGSGAGPLALRLVIFGGEALDTRALKPWFDRHGSEQPRLVNMYGITETTVHVTYRPLSEHDLENASRGSIGLPLPDLQCSVLDCYGQLVPEGVAGELHVGGAGLARGYLNRPELTAERFIQNPYLKDGGRLYRTGDLVRQLPGGELVYMGRIDQQVKIRGFRIELGEIEALLLSHPDIQDAVVLARKEPQGDTRLVAWLVCSEQPSIDELRDFLRKKLPGHMLPAAFVFLDVLPLTPNGKLDTRALPVPEHSRPNLEESYVAPRTEIEKILARIWRAVLEVDRVGIHDNFFSLGGDSIRSIPVISRAKDEGLDLSLQQLFRARTIETLALELGRDRHGVSLQSATQPFSLVSSEDRERLPDDVEDAFPLSMLQAGMLFHMEYAPGLRLYHNVTSSTLRTRFEPEVFREAVSRVVARHGILRTSFDFASYSEPLQLVHRTATVVTGYEDIRHRTTGEQEQLIDSWLEQEKNHGFDIAQAPLLRFHIHQLDDDLIQFTITECHVLFDGWSENATLMELWQLHFDLLEGRQLPPPTPPRGSYRDFVALERRTLKSDAAKAFWSSRLSGCEPLVLPRWPGAYRAPSTTPVCMPGIRVNREKLAALQQLARSQGVPFRNVLLAAHLFVLRTLTGRTDLLSGVVMHGRLEEGEGEQVRGLFLNMLPLRLELAGGSWQQLMQASFEAERDVLSYRRYPMAQIMKDLGHERLFEAAFGYVHFHVMEELFKSRKLKLEGEVKRWTPTDFPLMTVFSHDPLGNELTLHLDHDASVLTAAQIDAIGGYYLKTLDEMLRVPTSNYEYFCPLPPEEMKQILVEWNASESDYPAESSLIQLFEEQVRRTPHATALIDGQLHLSYDELNRCANRLAAYLQDAGVTPEAKVGLCMQRSVDSVVATLAILKAGGIYVPLDPEYPRQRLVFMTEDVQCPVILALEKWAGALEGYGGRILFLDSGAEAINSCDSGNTVNRLAADNIAYIMYTSGSTGRPKGITVSHRAVNRLVKNTNYIEIGAGDVIAHISNISFDAATFEIWGALLNGAALVILSKEEMLSPEAFSACIRQQGITSMFLTTALFNRFANAAPGFFKHLKYVLFGGEAVDTRSVAAVLGHGPPEHLVHVYGPTEGTTFTSWYPVTRKAAAGETLPIGRPIANTQVYILDKHLNPVPTGSCGEIFIGGSGLADGYHNRPDLTAERFVPSPFGSAAGTRLYRSGDLACYLPDGNIEFVGRMDDQVKVRGYRIELGEVEAVLGSHESIREAVVIVREDRPGEKRLVAYLVTAGAGQLSTTELRQYAGMQLPSYMVPAIFVYLESLPLTANGKIDRKSLPVPDLSRPDLREEYAAPGSDAEKAVAGLWCDVIGIEQVGIHDNFFELGGDSLMATRLVTRLRNYFRQEISLQSVFDYPTVATFTREIEHVRKPGDEREEFEL